MRHHTQQQNTLMHKMNLMYPKGVVPNGEARTYEDAYSLEKAVLEHKEAINDNADAIEDSSRR